MQESGSTSNLRVFGAATCAMVSYKSEYSCVKVHVARSEGGWDVKATESLVSYKSVQLLVNVEPQLVVDIIVDTVCY